MKKTLLSLLAFGAMAMVSCQDDLVVSGPGAYGEGDGSFAYINATVSLPYAGGSRSATDEEGQTNSNGSSNTGNESTDSDNPTKGDDYEYGYAYENDVRSMVLVITNDKDEYLTHLVINGMTQASETGKPYNFNITTRIPYDVLDNAYAEGGVLHTENGEKPKVNIYAFCNYTQNLLSQYNKLQQEVKANPQTDLTQWRDFHGGVEEKASMAGETPQSTNSIWSPRSFLMANAEVYTTTFPENIGEWDQYADDKNPYEVSNEAMPIKVERVAARIDFRDASEEGDQVYKIWIKTSLWGDAIAADADAVATGHEGEKNLFSVQLKRMVLVNMSKDFYYLRRVSDDGLNNNPTYCGIETPYNYVVDYYADVKAQTKDGEPEPGQEKPGITPSNASKYFNFPLFDETGNYYNNIGRKDKGETKFGWFVSDISDVLKGNTDNWNNDQKYHIWRYVTENTLPGIDQQQVIQSTGIIFKAAIIVGDDIDATYNNDEAGQGERYVSEDVKKALNAVKDNPKTENKPYLDEDTKTPLPAIYSFHNMLFAGVADIVASAKTDGNGGALYFAVDQILNKWYLKKGETEFKFMETAPTTEEIEKGDYVQLTVVIADEILNHTPVTDNSFDYSDGYKIDFKDADPSESLKDFDNSKFIELAPAQNITVFIPTNDDNEGWGYYCYYFYWNRHNDNGLSGKMGKMEFATVRNNVYKLAVTKINAIGHPRDTTRDPDPLKPNEPDEKPERSIEVEVNVLPWVVRVNNIEF
ncbi:MAG: Mfa1 fimbrilin C-terminal domain-containing protein [Duncaniella sp.]|nr:Mfa1 fimbrilin C-terminal domain-containing protein [Duncaniella sp.]